MKEAREQELGLVRQQQNFKKKDYKITFLFIKQRVEKLLSMSKRMMFEIDFLGPFEFNFSFVWRERERERESTLIGLKFFILFYFIYLFLSIG